MDTTRFPKIQTERTPRTRLRGGLTGEPGRSKGVRRVRASGGGSSTTGKPAASAVSDWYVVYVLEGALTFFWGSEHKAAVPGSYFYQPRGIPHGFRVEGSTRARMLYLTFPAGLDRFVVEQEHLVPNAEPVIAAAHYQIEILGPLPE